MSQIDIAIWIGLAIELGKLAAMVCLCYILWTRPEFLKWLVSLLPKALSPVVVDGTLYVCIAMFLAIQSYFTSEEAYKYVNPYLIFWIKGVCAVLGAGAGALKMYRSRTYSDHVDGQNSSLPNPTDGAKPVSTDQNQKP